MSEMANDTEAKAFRLVDFYKQNGLSLGSVDLFMVGRSSMIVRLGEFSAILRMFMHEGRPLLREIIVILPSSEDPSDTLALIKAAFSDAWENIQGSALPLDQLYAAFRIVRYIRTETLQVGEILDLIRSARPRTAFIIGEAALYRADDVNPPSREVLAPEDIWTPHLHVLADRAIAVSRESDCYVLLDAGKFYPERTENRDLLCAVDGCAICSADNPDMSELSLIARAERWYKLALEGHLGLVLAEIEALDNLSKQQKLLMRLHMFNLVGFGLEVKTALKTDPSLTIGLAPDVALQVAIIAENVNEDEIAGALLVEAISALHMQEHLESALSLADRLQNIALVGNCEGRLSSLFPKSKVLRSHQVKVLAHEHRFSEASKLLSQGGMRETEVVKTADFFELLAQHLKPNQATDAAALMEAVVERFPDRTAEAKRFCAKQLESEGRRREAIALLLEVEPAGIMFDQYTAWAALSMVERGRLVFDSAIDDETVKAVITRTIQGLSHRPKDGSTRLRLARTLSPQILGASATPFIVSVVLSLAERNVTIRDQPPLNQRPGPCSPEELQDVIARGFTWFDKEGSVVVLGRSEFPSDLLNVPPDQAVAGFERMIEFGGNRLDDEDDLRSLEACLVMATAIAPLGSEPDEDLVVLRLAAGKIAHAGHVQRARDLAEQALAVAGDNPHRARLAWFAFADIYARLGNRDMALIGLACALAVHEEATWTQIWHESLLIFRLLRDLGLIDLARPLLRPAREALKNLGVEEHLAYGLRPSNYK